MRKVIGRYLVASVLLVGVITAPALAQRKCGVATSHGKIGGLLGGVAGGIFGNKLRNSGLDSGSQRSISAFLGDAIACALSDREQKQASDTQTRSLESGKVGTASESHWTSTERPSVKGGTKVTSRSTNNGQNCAVTTTFVTDENGKEQSVTRELCQGSDGGWA